MTSDVIKGFNRDTACLATGVLGAIIFAALVLAVQEHNPTKVNPTEEAVQAGSDRLPNANFATLGSVVAMSSNDKMASGEGNGVDHAFNKTSPEYDSFSHTERAGSAPTPVFAFAPEINRDDTPGNSGSGTLVHRQDSSGVRGLKVRKEKNRSSPSFGTVEVKRRLIELWHQSLARGEKSRNWTAFSKLNNGLKKKAAYTPGGTLYDVAYVQIEPFSCQFKRSVHMRLNDSIIAVSPLSGSTTVPSGNRTTKNIWRSGPFTVSDKQTSQNGIGDVRNSCVSRAPTWTW